MSLDESVGVSVLMTAYNAGGFLKEAVDSILGQSFTNWELILFDNGSTDTSVAWIGSDDKRIRNFSSAENIGRTKALQFCLDLARFKYTAILDADDIALPSRFERQVAVLEADPSLVLVGSQYITIGDSRGTTQSRGQISGHISDDLMAERNYFVNSTTMFRTGVARQLGGYNPIYEYAQDYDLFIRLATKGRCFIIDEPLIKFRRHTESYTNQVTAKLSRTRDEYELFRRARQHLNLSRTGRRLNRRRQAIACFTRAFYEAKLGSKKSALMSIIVGLRSDPYLSWIPYLLRGRKAPCPNPRRTRLSSFGKLPRTNG